MFKGNKGITLVALVITIIILLILAVVSIRLVMNEGIITKAQTATENYQVAEEKEQIKLAYVDYQMQKAQGETSTMLTVTGAAADQSIDGWTITFNETKNKYTLLTDGTIIDGAIEYTKFTLTANNYTQAGITREGDVVIPATFQYEGVNYKITTIGDSAFDTCTNLTSVTIPNSVTTIGNDAFYACRKLTSVTIPNSVTTIGDRAFYNCYTLASVVIPNSVTTIGDSAFYDSGITSIEIPSSVAIMGDYVFRTTSDGTAGFKNVVWNGNNYSYTDADKFNSDLVNAGITTYETVWVISDAGGSN